MNNFDTIQIKAISGIEYLYLPYSGLILNKQLLENDAGRISEFQNIEYLIKKERMSKRCEKVVAKDVELYIRKAGLQELLIEVTTGCNLRCSYCVFSGNYSSQRSHGNQIAKFSEIKKAIDYYYSLIKENEEYNVNRKPTVAFYGGEPLLNYNVIRQSIEYINEKYSDYGTFFTLTTNGTLLNEEMMDFFINNEVWIVFSLDGDKVSHDRNRKNAAGEGSFEKAYDNIKKFQKRKGGVVFVNSVYDYKTDLERVMNFFVSNPYLINLSASIVNPYDTKYYDRFNLDDVTKFNKQVREMRNMFFDKIKDKNEIWNSTKCNMLNLLVGKPALSVIFRKILGMQTNQFFSFTGSCVPGEKLFVDINGSIKPCEKIGKDMEIGTIEKGLDYYAISEIINNFSDLVKDCVFCKYNTMCSLCYQAFWRNGRFTKNDSLCNSMREHILETLSLFVSIQEIQPRWLDAYSGEYYNEIQSLGVTLL